MEGWSKLNLSYIDVEIDVFDECEERLKRLFDQALLVFLEEEGKNRPLPALLGDGEGVDLFKLFVLVRERQGFDSVSRKGLWQAVAHLLGFDSSLSPSLSLIYSKYLGRMEKWALDKSRIVNWDYRDEHKRGCYGGLLHELGDGFKCLLDNGKRNRPMPFACNHLELEHSGGSHFHRSSKRLRESIHVDVEQVELEMSCVDLTDEQDLDFSSENQQDLPGILNWLTSVATCPHNPSIGVIPQCSKWKEFKGNEPWIQVSRAKKALLVQRDNADFRFHTSPLLGHQTMHPSMYEDDRRSTGRLRCSIRRPQLSNGSSVGLTKSVSSSCRELVVACKKSTTPEGTDLIAGDLQASSNAIAETKKAEIPRRYVAVGRHYQARVDEWTESGLESDSKWLGTRIWPLGNEESLDESLIGKGRPDCCSCDIFRCGSVECIRFHIAEKRMELKRDIGDVFFHWRFNQMGEEVCLRWTEREEKRFKEMMILDSECFWENAVKCFRGKKREQLVSYYFNVFLINRRRYQNRVTPSHIDSDDEENFGCVGNGFGRDAVTSSGSDIMICSQNTQCDELD